MNITSESHRGQDQGQTNLMKLFHLSRKTCQITFTFDSIQFKGQKESKGPKSKSQLTARVKKPSNVQEYNVTNTYKSQIYNLLSSISYIQNMF